MSQAQGKVLGGKINLTYKSRSKKLKIFPKEYTLEAIVFQPKYDIIMSRLKARELETDKHIPDNVLQEMWVNFEFPSVSEGFTKVTYHYD